MQNLKEIEAITWDEFKAEAKLTPERMETLSEDKLKMLMEYKFELEERQKNYGILYYRPQDYQKKFHASNKKVRLVLGGNQTGKTESGVAEDVRIALGIDPYEKIRVPNRMRICANDLDKGIGEVIMPKLDKLLPPSCIRKISKYSGGQWKKVVLENGSSIELLSYEQEDKMYEGWTGDYVHFDEPPPQSKFVSSMRGLMRYAGKVAITATPLNEPWIYDEIYLKGIKGEDSGIDVFEFSLYDNKYLTDYERDEFIKVIPEEEREARVFGRFKHLSGLVYKEFGISHLVDSFEIPKDWVRICAMDYHSRKACAVVWIAISEDDTAYVYDELQTQGTISQISEKIVAKEQEQKGTVNFRFIDSISATPDRISGNNAQREFLHEGKRLGWNLNFRSSTKNWVLGKNAVSEYLMIINGKAGIYFFKDKCRLLIDSMGKYVWQDANVSQGVVDKVKKVWDDFPDALRYGLVNRIKYSYVHNTKAEVVQNNLNSTTGYSLGA